jgi:hypothetical protein
MFSVAQKRSIAEKVQSILRETGHHELPTGEITFHLHVEGAESWSWADIVNNGAVSEPSVDPWNEAQVRSRTDYVDTDGNLLFSDPWCYRSLFAIGQEIIHESRSYRVLSASISGPIQTVTVSDQL